MPRELQLFGLGSAAVIDTVLIMALLERPNRRHVALWMFLLTFGAWLWHAGSFIHTLLLDSTHWWPLRINALAMTTMASGLLVMPSAMMHGAIRLWHSGVVAKPPADARYGLCYMPLLAAIPISQRLFESPSGDFLQTVAPFTTPFVAWLCLSNFAAAGTFVLRRDIALPHARHFFPRMAGLLGLLSALVVFAVFVAIPAWPDFADAWKLAVSLSPVVPAILFAYYVMRFGFVSLVLERALVYGALLATLFLVHQLVLRDVTDRLTDQLQVDFAIIEVVLALGFVAAYQPVRRRVAEALRYLLGSRIANVREATRQLASRISDATDLPMNQVLATIVEELRTLFGVQCVGLWLWSEDNHLLADASLGECLTTPEANQLRSLLNQHGCRLATRFDAPIHAVSEFLDEHVLSTALAFSHRDLQGLLVLGRKRLNQPLTDEELSSLVLLAEQLAVTLRNSRLQQDRLAAERRALRQEKLSTLGLLASSIAHEIKNPLSSIRTIATVVAEELGADSHHAEDLRLIVSEIDRLTTSTRQLLDFARPVPPGTNVCQPREILERTLRILRQLAKHKHVRVEENLDAGRATVQGDPASLGEVLFNLLTNSIEAAGVDGVVRVSCRHAADHVQIVIQDTGPGLPPEVQDNLFGSFVTTKLDGNGLGLYIVGRRVRELGAEIRCETSASQGTSFELRIPISQTSHSSEPS